LYFLEHRQAGRSQRTRSRHDNTSRNYAHSRRNHALWVDLHVGFDDIERHGGEHLAGARARASDGRSPAFLLRRGGSHWLSVVFALLAHPIVANPMNCRKDTDGAEFVVGCAFGLRQRSDS
jgi:hypothetical protein